MYACRGPSTPDGARGNAGPLLRYAGDPDGVMRVGLTRFHASSRPPTIHVGPLLGLTVKRIKLGARNRRTDPSSQKRSPRLEYLARSAGSIHLPSEAP